MKRLIAILLAAPAVVVAQQVGRAPHIGYVYPAGGQQGTTVEVVVGGQFLDGLSGVRMSDPALTASVVEYTKPLNNKQVLELRDRLKELQDRRAMGSTTKPALTSADAKEAEEIRRRLATFVRRPSSPAIAETATLRVVIPDDAAPGPRELRVSTPAGLSNPLVFCVGQLPEVVGAAVRGAAEATGSVPRQEAEIVPPATVNGQILPGGVDRYTFAARQGEQLVVRMAARQLIPYVADAVPGWFQATVALYDAKGGEVAYNDDFRFDPDPVLLFQVPDTGRYTVEIKDAIYRGREDFVYRMTIGNVPYVTGVFPLGAPAGSLATFDLRGKNLAAQRLTERLPDGAATHLVSARNRRLLSEPFPVAAGALPEEPEREPNDVPARARPTSRPVVVNGRVEKPGDVDAFRIDARAGETIVAEVTARRLRSPLDSLLRLTDTAGTEVAASDDYDDPAVGLQTHQADSYVSYAVPADGTYYLLLADAQGKGGTEYAYRLRISHPRPDFELRVVPSAVNARAGTTASMVVHAVRRDGFDGEIVLSIPGGPEGFRLTNARIPAGKSEAKVGLTVPRTPTTRPVVLSVEGKATVAGAPVTRRAVPADDRMQAFLYRHLVPANELLVSVTGRASALPPSATREKSVSPSTRPTIPANADTHGARNARKS